MASLNECKVYTLSDPRTGEVRYIGQTITSNVAKYIGCNISEVHRVASKERNSVYGYKIERLNGNQS